MFIIQKNFIDRGGELNRKMNSGRLIFSLILVLTLNCTSLFAQSNKFDVPDSSKIRASIKNSWLKNDFSSIRGKPTEERKNEIGINYQIRLEENEEFFKIIVAPETLLDMEYVCENGIVNRTVGVYLEGSSGSWVLQRNKKTGKPEKITWYFNADSDVYLQIRPEDNRTVADMVVFKSFIARSVPVPSSFENFYTCSFRELYNWTARSIPWNKVVPVPGQYHSILQMAAVIHEAHSRMDYIEDSCYDEDGKLCRISTGKGFKIGSETNEDITAFYDNVKFNADTSNKKRLALSNAGFVKWVCDGLINPVEGKGTKISELLEETMEINKTGRKGILSQNYNLTFTLDWCRNLAARIMSLNNSRDVTWLTGGVDVTLNFFSCEITANGEIKNSSGYIKNTGYEISKVKPMMYALGVSEPGYFYLGAIKEVSKNKTETAFNNCAVFFPYFDDAGRFDCKVFEGGMEMSLESFVSRYPDSFVHLERCKSSDYFFPY